MGRRYQQLIGVNYSHDTVYILSASDDRVLMSSSCTAYGLFPAQGQQVWYGATNWQPVPIHELPSDKAYLLLPPGGSCAKLSKSVDDYLASDEIQSKLKMVTNLQKYLEFHSGSPFKSLESYYHFYDAVNTEWLMGLP